MRYLFEFICVLALGVMPLAGCSDDEGVGGSGGAGGMAGTGGSEPSPVGLWTGSGQGGADGSFTICFNVSEDGSGLVPPLDASPECDNHSFEIEFDVCEGALLVGGGGSPSPSPTGSPNCSRRGAGRSRGTGTSSGPSTATLHLVRLSSARRVVRPARPHGKPPPARDNSFYCTDGATFVAANQRMLRG